MIGGFYRSRIVDGVSKAAGTTPQLTSLIGATAVSTVLLLHMDGTNGSTTFTDVCGKVTQAYANAQISTTQSKFGGSSGYFDGSGDYVLCQSFPMLGDFTIEFFGRLENVSGGHSFVAQPKAYQMQFFIRTENGVLSFGPGWPTSYTLSISTWYHIAVTKASGLIRCFVDGVQRGSTANDGAYGYVYDGSSLVLGRDWDGSYSLNGYIDELRVSNFARYTSVFTAPTAPFILD